MTIKENDFSELSPSSVLSSKPPIGPANPRYRPLQHALYDSLSELPLAQDRKVLGEIKCRIDATDGGKVPSGDSDLSHKLGRGVSSTNLLSQTRVSFMPSSPKLTETFRVNIERLQSRTGIFSKPSKEKAPYFQDDLLVMADDANFESSPGTDVSGQVSDEEGSTIATTSSTSKPRKRESSPSQPASARSVKRANRDNLAGASSESSDYRKTSDTKTRQSLNAPLPYPIPSSLAPAHPSPHMKHGIGSNNWLTIST